MTPGLRFGKTGGAVLNPKLIRQSRSLSLFMAAAQFLTASRAAEPEATSADLPRVPPREPAEALKSFALRPGLRIELAASEPLVVDPIAMSFDENGRLFVIEMRDYSERRDERLGRVRLLEDTDGDGRMDKSTIYAENLPWPTALLCYGGGVFVGSTPDIFYFKDTDGDGKADESRLVFSGFGATVQRLNVQALLNSFTWGLDNRIHGASGGNGGIVRCPDHPDRPPVELRNSDFSFDPRTLEFRLENGGGQYGMTFDNFGRKFVCSNSAHIRQVMYERDWVLPNMTHALPSPALDIPVDGPAGPVFRTSPDEPWRVLRTKWRLAGLVPGPIESGKPSGFFTSATGLTIYRGDAIPELAGDAIVADVGSNLVHRKKLRPNGAAFAAERAPDEKDREFLTSTDLWFRPVSFANGPDGALYLADMYREVIEHPWSIPETIKQHLDLNSGNDRGRIYRIVPEGFKQPKPPKLGELNTPNLVKLLAHPNGWHRDTAARLLYERQDTNALPFLTAKTDSALASLHALHALRSLGQTNLVVEALTFGLRSQKTDVLEALLRLAIASGFSSALPQQLAENPSPAIRALYAWALARQDPTSSAKKAHLEKMLAGASDSWERHAIQAALSVDPKARTETAALRAQPAMTRPVSRQKVIDEFRGAIDLKGDARKGAAIFEERCASCHRIAGRGNAVGPDIESVRSAGRETVLSNILDPNREVQLRYLAYEITLRDGESISGILSHESANGLTLLQANGSPVFVPRGQVDAFRATGLSLMPEGLEAGLSPQDVADLLTHLGL